MFAPPSKTGKIIRRFACCALVLWLAGVGCIIGCEMQPVAAAAAHNAASPAASSENEESCSISSGKDCCKKKKNDQGDASEESDGEVHIGLPLNGMHLSCCPLAVVSADPARKVSNRDAPVAPAKSGSPFSSGSRTLRPLPFHKLRVPDRGSTHLRCCVFLI
jgi:hypothetical protein